MAKTYRKNGLGRMSRIWYQRLSSWSLIWLLFILIFIVFYQLLKMLEMMGLNLWLNFKPICMGFILVGLVGLIGLIGFQFWQFWKNVKNWNRLGIYLQERKSVKSIEKGLLSAGLVRKTMSENVVDVPTCVINEVDQRKWILKIERLPSVSDIDKVAAAVNSSLRFGKFADYAVSQPKETPDGLYYLFELEDVNRDLTFIPKSISDLIPANPYVFKLMENQDWNYVQASHAIISGLTGSHKTTTMISILAQALGAGAEIFIIDYKHELSGMKRFLGSDHVKSDPNDILELLGRVVNEMKERHKKIALEAQNQGKLGVTGADFNVRPVFIIAEEMGALSEAYDAKEKKLFHGYLKNLAMLGRSSLYNVITLVQVATVESVPAGIKSNTNLKILLEKSTSEMVVQMFSNGYSDQVTNNPGAFRGWYFLNGSTSAPALFFTPNLYKNGLNNLEIFEKLYEIGRKREYNETM